MSTEAQLKRVFEEKSGEMKTALLLSALQAIRTPGSRFTVFIFSVYPTKEFCHCSWHQGAPQIYPGNSQIRKTRKSTDFRPLLWFAQECAEETGQLWPQEVAWVFLYGSTTSNQAHMLRKVWIIPFAHVCTSLSLPLSDEVVWCQGDTSVHIGEIRGSNVSNLFVLVFHGCFALQSVHNCHKRELGMDSACFIFYSYLRYSAWCTFNIKGSHINSRQMAFRQQGSDAFINRINRPCHLLHRIGPSRCVSV